MAALVMAVVMFGCCWPIQAASMFGAQQAAII